MVLLNVTFESRSLATVSDGTRDTKSSADEPAGGEDRSDH